MHSTTFLDGTAQIQLVLYALQIQPLLVLVVSHIAKVLRRTPKSNQYRLSSLLCSSSYQHTSFFLQAAGHTRDRPDVPSSPTSHVFDCDKHDAQAECCPDSVTPWHRLRSPPSDAPCDVRCSHSLLRLACRSTHISSDRFHSTFAIVSSGLSSAIPSTDKSWIMFSPVILLFELSLCFR